MVTELKALAKRISALESRKMKLVVVGGHSRSVGKTSLAAGIIAANPELHWTALKITQYGHGICSAHGHDCTCVIEDPDCPYAISRELDRESGSDTSRFLNAGAEEVYWARTRVGQLENAMPALRDMIASREFVIMESNSILRFLRPDIYLPLLRFDVDDFKLSSRIYLQARRCLRRSRFDRLPTRMAGDPAQLARRKARLPRQATFLLRPRRFAIRLGAARCVYQPNRGEVNRSYLINGTDEDWFSG